MSSIQQRASAVDYPINQAWRFAIYEEPGDIVIRVDHSHSTGPPNWHNVVRLEQSGERHPNFHMHIKPDAEAIDIPDVNSRDEKIVKGMEKLKELVEEGLVECNQDTFEYSARWEEIKAAMLKGEIAVGDTWNSRSIAGTARIIKAE